MTRLIIQFSGYHENGCRTDKQYQILNIKGEVSMKIIKKELADISELSIFRRNKEIEIFYMQSF